MRSRSHSGFRSSLSPALGDPSTPLRTGAELGRFMVLGVIGLCLLSLALLGCDREESAPLLEPGGEPASSGVWLDLFPVAKDHPDLERAGEVFARMRESVGVYADLYVLEMGRSPRALALPDAKVLLSESGLDLCYDGVSPEVGDARLAFLFGHELTHVANNDFWHAAAFAMVQNVGGEGEALRRLQELLAQDDKDRQVLELKADQAGILAMIQADYDPASILRGDRSFFEEWTGGPDGSLAYGDPSHPTPADRAEFLRHELEEVAGQIDLFHQGVAAFEEAEHLAAQVDGGEEVQSATEAEYAAAIESFDRFRAFFDGREVLSNLALAHLRLAALDLARCDGTLVKRYYLPTAVDPVTLAERARNRGAAEHSSPCFDNEEYEEHMTAATRLLEEAVKRDSRYLPGRLDSVAAYVLDEKDANARLHASEAVRIAPDDENALNGQAVANLLAAELGDQFVDAESPIVALAELHRRFPDSSAIAFNLASALSYRGRLDEARPVWRDFLELEPDGPWAKIAREWVGDEPVDQIAP